MTLLYGRNYAEGAEQAEQCFHGQRMDSLSVYEKELIASFAECNCEKLMTERTEIHKRIDDSAVITGLSFVAVVIIAIVGLYVLAFTGTPAVLICSLALLVITIIAKIVLKSDDEKYLGKNYRDYSYYEQLKKLATK